MKKIILSITLCLIVAVTHAAQNPDSVAYQLQRNKINGMLEQRRQKFGKYTESLTKHTGIFGLQTKKDIKRTNDILMDIVKSDDSLYTQIKILLTYKTFQQSQAVDKSLESEQKSMETEQYNIGLMNAINKMRDQNQKLKTELEDTNKSKETLTRNCIIILAFVIVSLLIIVRNKYVTKR